MAQFEKLEHNMIKMEVRVPAEKFDEGLTRAYIKEAKRFTLPGFRKGKAPRKMIEKAYGEGVFYEGAFDEVYYEAYISALQENGLMPVDAPQIDVLEIGEGKELVFTTTFPVAPEVTVTPEQYKGIEVERQEYTVTDEQVDAAIAREREQQARFVTVERPIENGDKILFDYSGSVDGVKFDGGTAENTTLDIGSGMFIPGFEEQLIGASAGEDKTITVTFPEQYQAEHLAGKEAVFACRIKEVKQKELPELDDEFAKDNDFDTFEEYKASVRAKLEEQAARRTRNAQENAAVTAVANGMDFEIPNAMIEHQIDHMVQDLEQQMSYSGMRLEQYLQAVGMEMKTLRDNYRPSAALRVRGDLILAAIVKAEGLVGTDEEVEAEFADYAKSIGKEVDEVKEMMKGVNLEEIKQDIAMRKAIDLIVENAVLVEPKKPEEQPAAQEEKPAEEQPGAPAAE